MRFIPTVVLFAALVGATVGCHCRPERSTHEAVSASQPRDLDAELQQFFETWSNRFLFDYSHGVYAGFTPFKEMRPEVGAVARDPEFMHELVMNWIELDLERANRFGSGGPVLMIYLLTAYEHYTGLQTSALEERMWEHWVKNNPERQYVFGVLRIYQREADWIVTGRQ